MQSSSISNLKRLQDLAWKKEDSALAQQVITLSRELLYLNGCVAKARGMHLDPDHPSRNVFLYIKELEAKCGIQVDPKK